MLVTLTGDIVAAHASKNRVAISDTPPGIWSVHEILSGRDVAADPGVKHGRRCPIVDEAREGGNGAA